MEIYENIHGQIYLFYLELRTQKTFNDFNIKINLASLQTPRSKKFVSFFNQSNFYNAYKPNDLVVNVINKAHPSIFSKFSCIFRLLARLSLILYLKNIIFRKNR